MKQRTSLLILLVLCSVASDALLFHPFEAFYLPSLSLDYAAAHPGTPVQLTDVPRHQSRPLISNGTSTCVETLIREWNSTGISLAVVQKDPSVTDPEHPGWRVEFGSYGTTSLSTTAPITCDTLFAIASNSKLFLSMSVGLLLSNKTLAKEFRRRHGVKLNWKTKMVDVLGPELWSTYDEDIQRGATIEDLLVHRTGLPRHDYSGFQRSGGVHDMISKLRYLRPSATFRDTFQYNNLMYETLSYLPVILLNQSYESYVAQHIFQPLNMSSTTFSVAQAEESGNLAEGHLASDRDFSRGLDGTLKPIVPYWFRPGEERTWAGAGGVISSGRDLATWTAMLLNEGKHPYTNETFVPKEVLDYITAGRMVMTGKSLFPDTSPLIYGPAQFVYSYRGVGILEHGGNNPGFKSQIARVPSHNLGIVSLSNDGETGGFVLEAAKWRVIDDLVFGGSGGGGEDGYVDWSSRYHHLWDSYKKKMQDAAVPPPSSPKPPTKGFGDLGRKKFSHGAYGELVPCLVPDTFSVDEIVHDANPQQPLAFASTASASRFSFVENPHANCSFILSQQSTRQILDAARPSSSNPPKTYIIPFPRSFSTVLLLRHWSENIFNVSVVWNNAGIREKEGLYFPRTQSRSGESEGDSNDGGDLVIGLDETFTVEWVYPNRHHDEKQENENDEDMEEGLAFKGGFWGQEGPDAKEPSGEGKEGAEVWFALDV